MVTVVLACMLPSLTTRWRSWTEFVITSHMIVHTQKTFCDTQTHTLYYTHCHCLLSAVHLVLGDFLQLQFRSVGQSCCSVAPSVTVSFLYMCVLYLFIIVHVLFVSLLHHLSLPSLLFQSLLDQLSHFTLLPRLLPANHEPEKTFGMHK